MNEIKECRFLHFQIAPLNLNLRYSRNPWETILFILILNCILRTSKFLFH